MKILTGAPSGQWCRSCPRQNHGWGTFPTVSEHKAPMCCHQCEQTPGLPGSTEKPVPLSQAEAKTIGRDKHLEDRPVRVWGWGLRLPPSESHGNPHIKEQALGALFSSKYLH